MSLTYKKDKLLYLVEGECEAALIRAIKNEYIYSGKVLVFNPWTKRAGNLTRNIKKNTICILIFDTDEYKKGKDKGNQLKENLKILEKYSKEIIVICQNDTLEDELVKSCSIKKIEEFLNIKSINEHKKKFIKINNLLSKLKENNFDIKKIWIGKNLNFLPENNSEKIKKEV